MDLNASPEPEEDEVFPEQQTEEDTVQEKQIEYNKRVDHGEPAISISRREREERIQRMRRQHFDDIPSYEHQLSQRDDGYQVKRQRLNSKLPPGWLDCPAHGNNIGPLVPSKVPLGEFFNEDIIPGKRYSSKQVVRQQRVAGRKICMVIDLTNSSRYYNVIDWKKEGIKHVKIACKGRDSVPENEAVNQFVYEVSQFVARRRNPKEHILVHCTHGHNRTGYMIVHYLMRTSSMSVTQAIQSFAHARPPGIYKPDYIDALYNFYHEKKPDMVVCPPTPEWKRSSDLDLNGDAVPDDDDDDGDSVAPPDESHKTQTKLSNDDILGDEIPTDQEIILRQFCYQTLKLPLTQIRGHLQFPGSHPVSLDRENLQLLRQRYYYATWKADGTRYMMLITMDGCYLIDRHFSFRRVQMRFPCRLTTNEKGVPERKYHHFTLLDGEMVIDTLPLTDKQERRFLVYDMMAINQVSLVERPFYERWKMIYEEVIGPRNSERESMCQTPYYRYELEPFRVRRKDFWLLSTVTKIFQELFPNLTHKADGLIFQGWDDPYVPRTHEGLLKWKFPEMNSVDFLFEMVDSRQLLYLFERGKKRLLDNRVVFPEGTEPSAYSGKIIECAWDSEKDAWIYKKVRVDKGTPNEFNTYRKVMRSIKDNITEDVVLAEIQEIIRLPMYTDRIQKESKVHSAHK